MIFSSILYAPIGYLLLWLRYRDKKRVKARLEKEYEGSYSVAGAWLMGKTFGILLFSQLSLFLLAIIGRILYDLMF